MPGLRCRPAAQRVAVLSALCALGGYPSFFIVFIVRFVPS